VADRPALRTGRNCRTGHRAPLSRDVPQRRDRGGRGVGRSRVELRRAEVAPEFFDHGRGHHRLPRGVVSDRVPTSTGPFARRGLISTMVGASAAEPTTPRRSVLRRVVVIATFGVSLYIVLPSLLSVWGDL